jgi:hypothetical protein
MRERRPRITLRSMRATEFNLEPFEPAVPYVAMARSAIYVFAKSVHWR